jgi:tetratricopeptide (TPR) repeat protein
MDVTPFSLPFLLTAAGILFIFVSVVQIQGQYNFEVQHPKIVLLIGIIFLLLGVILYFSGASGTDEQKTDVTPTPIVTATPSSIATSEKPDVTPTPIVTATPSSIATSEKPDVTPTLTVNATPSPTVTPEKSYTEWWSEGDILYKKGDYSGAVDCYNKAIELSPNNAELWNGKGYAFKEMGERDQTNSKSEQAKGEYKQAIIAFDKALELSNFNFQDAQDGKDFCLKQLTSLP